MKVGETYIHSFTITQAQVNAFAEVSGDNNPLHLNAEYAAETVFKKPIIHGMFGASIISCVLGTKFPGEGAVYLKQGLEFMRPMYVDVAYEARFIVKEIDEKGRATLQTDIYDQVTGKICTRGEATVMLPK